MATSGTLTRSSRLGVGGGSEAGCSDFPDGGLKSGPQVDETAARRVPGLNVNGAFAGGIIAVV